MSFWMMRVQICLSASRQPPAIISKGWDRHSLGYLKALVEYLCSKLIRTLTGDLEMVQTGWIWTVGASLCQPPGRDGDQPQPGGAGAHAGRPGPRGHVPGRHPGQAGQSDAQRARLCCLSTIYHLIPWPSIHPMSYIFHWFLASLGFDRIQCLFGLPMIFIFPWCTVHPCLYPKKAFCKLKQKINWSEIFFSCEQIFLNDCFAIKIYLIKRLFVNVIWSKLIFNNI